MNKIALLLVLYFWLHVQEIYSQDFPDIKFSFLNTANGLPTNLITTVFKDSRGLMWLGTLNNGLLRYDGKKIKSYYGIGTKGSAINANFVGHVNEDKQGWLWISTFEGLYHMNPITEETVVYIHDENDTSSLASNDNPKVFTDSKGRIWVTGRNGLQQFNPGTKSFINFYIPPVLNPELQFSAKDVINGIMEDSQHRLWVCCGFGLYLVNTSTHSLKPFFFSDGYMEATGITENTQHQLLVSFYGGGIKTFNPETGQYKDIHNPLDHSTRWLTEWEDESNKKWLCFEDSTVFTLLDPVTKKSKQYPVDLAKKNSIKSHEITYIYKDNEGRLWICTNEGISIVDKKIQIFSSHVLKTGADNSNTNSSGRPYALLVKSNEYILSFANSKHLYIYDKNWILRKKINELPAGASTLRYNPFIWTMQKDEQDNIWYGTNNGLVKQTGNRYKAYLPADTFHSVFSRNKAGNILKRTDGLYWARFSNRGLYVFDPVKEKFLKNYRQQYKGLARSIVYDKKGRLWLGTTEGLYVYQSLLDSFIKLPIIAPSKISNENYNIIGPIIFDEKNTGWVGTENGLLKLDPNTNNIEFITDPLKRQYYIVDRLLQDSVGNIWIRSTTALIAYSKNLKSFRYYSVPNGLPEEYLAFCNVFNWINDSIIAIGSSGTINTFNPYRLAATSNAAKVLFTDISIDGKRIAAESNRQLHVPPGTNALSLHFALLNYTAPQQNKLYYRIFSAKNEPWIETVDGDITLLNLSPGKYLLQVKGECNGDKMNSSTEEITIMVQPFWYQSAVFKLLIVLALSALVYFFIRWRIKSVRKGAALKQQITETEIAALKAQMNPHFIFNCINSIDAFIHSNDKYNATLYLNKFAKLLRNILDSSKENTVAFTKDIETLKLYVELEELRHENKFKTIINIEEELLSNDYKVPPLIIQPFVENAILHGLKNREDNDGVLQIDIKKAIDKIEYSIGDNGIGRKAAGEIVQNKQSSYGMQMSYDRIKLFNKEETASVQIHDLYIGEVATGTEVKVSLNII